MSEQDITYRQMFISMLPIVTLTGFIMFGVVVAEPMPEVPEDCLTDPGCVYDPIYPPGWWVLSAIEYIHAAIDQSYEKFSWTGI